MPVVTLSERPENLSPTTIALDRLEVLTIPVVLAHDYLTQRGGGERVALELTRHFPGAPLITSVYEADTTFPGFVGHDVRVTALNRFSTFRRDPRRAFAALAPVFSYTKVPPGVLLVSSSGWAHGLGARGPKVVYCHNPARWLYQPDDYFTRVPRPLRMLIALVLAPLRRWDRRAAGSVDVYLANSSSVAQRIKTVYGVEAEVVHPPAGLDREGPLEAVAGIEPGFFLTVGRRRAYKNTELVCAAVEQVKGARLVAVGGLPTHWAEGRGATGLVDVSDAQLRWLYANCCAVVAVGHEDFGLAPVEGYRFGKAAIVLRAGGYVDSGLEGTATTFVEDEHVDSLARALEDFDPTAVDAEAVRAHGEKFSSETFGRRLHEIVREVSRGTSFARPSRRYDLAARRIAPSTGRST